MVTTARSVRFGAASQKRSRADLKAVMINGVREACAVPGNTVATIESELQLRNFGVS